MTAGPGAVLVAADGSLAAGLGHLGRSTGLAAALRRLGLEVATFALGAPAESKLDGVRWCPVPGFEKLRLHGLGAVVVDSYRHRLAPLPAENPPLVLFHDDGGTPPPDAALVVAVGTDPELAGPRGLYGLRYACLRAAFWDARPRRHEGSVRRVLVTIGGSDALSLLGVELARAAAEALPRAEVSLVRGASVSMKAPAGVKPLTGLTSLYAPLFGADVVVTAGGQTLLEAAALGTPTVAVVAANNQVPQAQRLAGLGAVRLLEDPARDLAPTLAALEDPSVRGELARRAQAAVDGRGALRVAEQVAELARARG